MVIECFAKALKKGKGRIEVDRIPGTSKIRTYCSNYNLYSKESDLDRISMSNIHCSDKSIAYDRL